MKPEDKKFLEANFDYIETCLRSSNVVHAAPEVVDIWLAVQALGRVIEFLAYKDEQK